MQNREKQRVSVAAATSSPATIGSRARILSSLVKLNPFGKLRTNDLNKDKTPPFSVFCARTELYSFPKSQSEAAARVQTSESSSETTSLTGGSFDAYGSCGLLRYVVARNLKEVAGLRLGIF
ncbi:unnamed protein product [Arabis nemorensis]|uniref:Uncharacterized protein n=1 Tax=Arabis nemorensis TaxID=586526 RepID=A0A565B7Q3_9BRAS|nr:unnamed protein product [Arabis nemorensis]